MTTSKAALHFPPDYALALAAYGQSNQLPVGNRDTEGYVASPHLALRAAGADLTVLGISGNYVVVSEGMQERDYRNGPFRLIHTVYGSGSNVEARVGYGTVRDNLTQRLTVDWAASASPTALEATVTFSTGTPGHVNLTTHGLLFGVPVVFTTDGTLPVGLTPGDIYYVIARTLSTFTIATATGIEINLTDTGSGTHKIVHSAPEVTGLSFGAASYDVNLTAHGLQAGNRVYFFDASGASTVPTGCTIDGVAVTLAYSTVYYVVPRPSGADADKFAISTTRGGSAILFGTAGTGAQGLHRRYGAYVTLNDRFKSYSNVKVLTPYQPEVVGDYPSTPASIPGTVAPVPATYEDAAMFLDFTWNEGVEGIGSFNDSLTGSGASGSTVSGLTITVTGTGFSANLYVDGYIAIENAAGDRWVGKIASNTSNTATVYAWTSSGGSVEAPSGNVAYEAHIPHWLDNPYHALPGKGFRYPSGSMQCAPIYNRPRGVFTPGYATVGSAAPVYKFGHLIEQAWRLSLMLGRTIYVVNLAVGGTGQILGASNNVPLYGGQIGWFDDDLDVSWSPGDSNARSLSARFSRMLTSMAPAALTAQGSTLKLRYIAISGFQGETDSLSAVGREQYRRSLPAFYAWLRDRIVTAGLSAYAGDVKIPVMHARIAHEPWEVTEVTLPVPPYIYPVANSDLLGLVNAGIEEFVARDGYAGTIDVDDSPKEPVDVLHFNGFGAALNGKLSAEVIFTLVCKAAAQGVDNAAVEISNMALALCGENGNVFSLDPAVDQSSNAALCAQFYPTARDTVSERHSWAFTTKIETLVSITKDAIRTEWTYAYAVPSNMASPIAVLPANAADDYYAPTIAPDVAAAYSGNLSLRVPQPVRFTIEHDAEGLPVLYTNEPDAKLRFNLRLDGSIELPKKFKLAVAWQLASLISGPLMKGDVGMTFSMRADALSRYHGGAAAVTDSQHRDQPRNDAMPWNR